MKCRSYIISSKFQFYTYLLLDPRLQGRYTYEGLNFCLLYEPFYVGKGTGKRINNHLWEAINTNKNVYRLNKIRKILEEDVELILFKIVELISNENSIRKEIELIAKIGRADKGLGSLTNMTDGGEGGDTSKSPNYQKGMTARNFYGENNPMYGKSAMKGRKHKNETIKKMSEKRKDFWDDINRGKQSDRWTGKNNPMFGKVPPNATKVVIEGLEYNSKADACRQIGITKHKLNKMLEKINE